MRLRLLLEGSFGPSIVDDLVGMVERQQVMDIDPRDGHGVIEARLVGAVPVEEGDGQ